MQGIKWIVDWVILALLFCKELAKSVQDVVLNVLKPQRVTSSAIVAVPLDVQSELGIALLANMITLTPGTTSLHISDDKKCLYIHVMNYSENVVNDIKQGFERRILKVLR